MKLFAPLLSLALVMPAFSAPAPIIPAARTVDWTPGVAVGVPGGIPTNRTHILDASLPPYNADRTGAADATAAIQAAINAASSGDVVFLPAGTYLLLKGLTLGPSRSGITLRGEGDRTVINSQAPSTGIFVGSNSDYTWTWPSTNNVITGGLTKGSTALNVANTASYTVGQLVRIAPDNDSAVPVISVNAYEGVRRQTTRIVAKTSNSLEIFPGLYTDLTRTRTVIHVAQFQANSIGIEDMLIDSSKSPATFTIWMEQCYGCWVKNVHVRLSANYHIFLNDSLNCEVRHCYLDQLAHTGSNGGGLLCNTISGCLIEDNIIYKAFPLIEVNHGSSGNVFAYNLCEDSSPGVAIDTNHGPHNSFNLYEGNISPNLQADGYFGSVSDDTLFRNWFHGHQPGAAKAGWSISLNRFTRNYSLVGNLIGTPDFPSSNDGMSFGNPNMGNSAYTGTAPGWTDGWVNGAGLLTQSGSAVSTSQPMFSKTDVGKFIMAPKTLVVSLITAYKDPQHVTVNSTQTLSNVDYIVTPGSAGYQELDTGVADSVIRTANYYYFTHSVPPSEATTAPLPASLFRRAKPDWFGPLAWPAFDSAAPAPRMDSIPAGYRYVHGVDPTPGASDPSAPPPPPPSSTTDTPPSVPTTPPQAPLNVRITHSSSTSS